MLQVAAAIFIALAVLLVLYIALSFGRTVFDIYERVRMSRESRRNVI